jgi:hypothetical protein
MESDRIGEVNLQFEAAKLFKPVVTAVQGVGDTQSGRIQALQDSYNTYQNNILQALTNQRDALQPLPMIEPSIQAAQAVQAAPQQVPTPTVVDFNKDLNLAILQTYGLTLPGDLINADQEEIEAAIKHSINVNKQIGSEKKKILPTRTTQEINQNIEDIKKYRNRLKALLDSRGLIVESTTGKGIKITPRGQLGRLQIDPNLLKTGQLKAYLGGQLVLDRPADQSLYDLLTKQFVASKEYTPEAVETFKDLVRLSGIQTTKRRRNRKVQLLKNTQSDIRWYNTPDQLVERLGLLVASKQAGNTGVANEISNIIDTLESSGYITRDQAIQLQSQV